MVIVFTNYSIYLFPYLLLFANRATCWPTFEPALLVNILANILARFAIGTNMLANIVSQTHMLTRFAMDSNMLANILDFERLF